MYEPRAEKVNEDQPEVLAFVSKPPFLRENDEKICCQICIVLYNGKEHIP